MTAKVPNYNALSSLLDRLAIENVKLGYFENALEHDKLDETTTVEYARKAEAQRDMLSVLKHDTVESEVAFAPPPTATHQAPEPFGRASTDVKPLTVDAPAPL